MAQPAFYPHPVDAVECRETHISLVFLAGDFAYKLKKPVGLDFLDFRTLERRREDCAAEVRLNARLAADVYDGVFPVTRDGETLVFNGTGEPVEYVVRMRRLPDDRAMPEMLARGRLDSNDLDRLAAALAGFYPDTVVSDGVGGLETVRENCAENFRQIRDFVPDRVSAADLETLRRATRLFLQRRERRISERLAEGHVRECHGDLRAEHIYFLPEGIRIIDGIEFNRRMRFGDVASDIAFLLMDLECQGFSQAAEMVLVRFLGRYDDPEMLGLLDFYRCYRAVVRLKVACFQLAQLDSAEADGPAAAATGDSSPPEAEPAPPGGTSGAKPGRRAELEQRVAGYAALALRDARRMMQPALHVVMGMIAAGKSTLALALGRALDAEVLRSDRIRRELFGRPEAAAGEVAFGGDIYRPAATERVYAEMIQRAQSRLVSGESVVLDASFRSAERRDAARALAEAAGVPVVFVECVCPDSTLRERLRARDRGGAGLSDARLSHLAEFRKQYEPPDEIPEGRRFSADTTRPVNALVAEVYLASRGGGADGP
jgi:hypothetical protein